MLPRQWSNLTGYRNFTMCLTPRIWLPHEHVKGRSDNTSKKVEIRNNKVQSTLQ